MLKESFDEVIQKAGKSVIKIMCDNVCLSYINLESCYVLQDEKKVYFVHTNNYPDGAVNNMSDFPFVVDVFDYDAIQRIYVYPKFEDLKNLISGKISKVPEKDVDTILKEIRTSKKWQNHAPQGFNKSIEEQNPVIGVHNQNYY